MTAPIRLPLPPSANRYWRVSKYGKVYVTKEAKAYKQEIGWLAKTMDICKLSGLVAMDIDVYRKNKRSDLKNFEKILSDALQGILFENDLQVCDSWMLRFDDRQNPRVEIWAWEVTEPRRRTHEQTEI